MSPNHWLEDRRWRWRVVVLVLLLMAVGALIWRGYDPLAAAGTTVMVFLAAAWLLDKIVNERGAVPPPPPSALPQTVLPAPVLTEPPVAGEGQPLTGPGALGAAA